MEAREAAQHPAVHQTVPPAKNYLVSNVNSSEAEKPSLWDLPIPDEALAPIYLLVVIYSWTPCCLHPWVQSPLKYLAWSESSLDERGRKEQGRQAGGKGENDRKRNQAFLVDKESQML